MKKKKSISMITAVCILSVMTSMVVYAYLTSSDRKLNTVIVGENDISFKGTPVDITSQTLTNINAKTISVTNDNDINCYVRVYLAFSDSEIAKNSYFAVSESKPDADADSWKTVSSYVSNLPDGWVYMTMTSNEEINQITWATPERTTPDGWYYYTDLLESGDSTTNLIEWIKTTYLLQRDIQDFDVYVYSESVQAALSEDGFETDNYQKAWEEYLYPPNE